MIEGLFYTLLQEIFNFSHDSSNDIKTLPKELKTGILNYHIKKTLKNPNALMKFKESANIEIPSFSEYIKEAPLHNGNLDSEKIREISSKFEVSLKKKSDYKHSASFPYIKDVRNKLAHGNTQSSEACRDKTANEINRHVELA